MFITVIDYQLFQNNCEKMGINLNYDKNSRFLDYTNIDSNNSIKYNWMPDNIFDVNYTEDKYKKYIEDIGLEFGDDDLWFFRTCKKIIFKMPEIINPLTKEPYPLYVWW